MKRLNVSNGVYERIRALCRNGGETDDQVLIGLLRRLGVDGGAGSSEAAASQPPAPTTVTGSAARAAGFVDATYGIPFPEGFEISRTYKGRPYAARVAGGRWVLDDGMAEGMDGGGAYDSLNQLSQAVIDGNENAWMFWFFKGPDGTKRRISELRDPAQVQKRPRRNRRRGARDSIISVAQGGVMPTPVAPPAAPVAPARAPRSVSGPPPARPAPPAPPEPAVGGMAWEPASKPKQG